MKMKYSYVLTQKNKTSFWANCLCCRNFGSKACKELAFIDMFCALHLSQEYFPCIMGVKEMVGKKQWSHTVLPASYLVIGMGQQIL